MENQNNPEQNVKKPEIIEYSTPSQGLQPKKKKVGLKIFAYLTIFCIISLAVFSTQVIISNQSGTSWFDKIPGISQLKNLAESANKELKGEDNDRINILLLGIGGKNHEGGLLTDTIMVASLQPSTQKVALISIPRDLTVPVEGMGWRKINSINALAEKENPGSGSMAISQAVSDLLDIPIDYYFLIDFTGFKTIIDELDGVKVYVDNTLDDYTYPVLGKEDVYPYESRFEHLHVEKGWQQMDGSLALKFARSRHGINGEGSDFARAKRQQKIIEATKEKLISVSTLFKPKMISNILNAVEENVDTNLKLWEMIKLWDMFGDTKQDDITNKVLDNSPKGLLVDGRGENGAYILAPRSGDFSEVRYMVHNIFYTAPQETKTKVSTEKASLEVRNGTWINGLASKVAMDLEKLGFDVLRIANANQQNFQKNVIYDLTGGKKASSLKILKDKTNANVSTDLPQWLSNEINNATSAERADFILILGQEADDSKSGAINNE